MVFAHAQCSRLRWAYSHVALPALLSSTSTLLACRYAALQVPVRLTALLSSIYLQTQCLQLVPPFLCRQSLVNQPALNADEGAEVDQPHLFQVCGWDAVYEGVTSENGKNRTVSRWHGLASRKRSFLRGFNENQIRASAGMACCFLENHSHIARLKQPSFENHENAVSRGWQLAQSRAVAGYRIS